MFSLCLACIESDSQEMLAALEIIKKERERERERQNVNVFFRIWKPHLVWHERSLCLLSSSASHLSSSSAGVANVKACTWCTWWTGWWRRGPPLSVIPLSLLSPLAGRAAVGEEKSPSPAYQRRSSPYIIKHPYFHISLSPPCLSKSRST